MKTVLLAGSLLFAASLAASSAVAAPPYHPAPQSERTKLASAGDVGLRGTRDAEDAVSLRGETATNGPRRLSALAGTDQAAWASAHSLKAVVWHKPPSRKPPQ